MGNRKGNYSKKKMPPVYNASIGLNIRQNRRMQNIKQETLAKTIGVSRIALSNYENNNWAVPLDVLLLAAKALHITPAILLEENCTKAAGCIASPIA